MGKLDVSEYKVASKNYFFAKKKFDRAKKERDNLHYSLRRDLISGRSTRDEFMDMCLYEYEDFKVQYGRMKKLEGLLKENVGQLMQISGTKKEIVDSREYEYAVVGKIGENVLGVSVKDSEMMCPAGFSRYFLNFNFDGDYVFYEGKRNFSGRHTGRLGKEAVFGFRESVLPFEMSASRFEGIKFGKEISSVSGQNIYVGNEAVSGALGLWGVEEFEFSNLNEFYDRLKLNFEPDKPISSPEKFIFLKRVRR